MSKILTYCVKSVNFDNSYKNVPFFRTEQERNNSLLDNCEFSPIFNFNFGNGLYTRAVVNNFDDNANYFILRIEENGVIDYKFYFITNYNYTAANQYMLSIECDVMSTYFVGVTRADFGEDLINRAHCNRFNSEMKDGKYHFDVIGSSEIIHKEAEIEKPIIHRNTLKLNYHLNSTVNDFLNANIKCWMYVYCDSKHAYTFVRSLVYNGQFSSDEEYEHIIDFNRFNIDSAKITNDYSVCCVPIMAEYASIEFYDESKNYRVVLDNRATEKFLKNYSPYIYNIKFSKNPPVYFGNTPFNFDLARVVFKMNCNATPRDGGHECSGFSIDDQVIRAVFHYDEDGVLLDYYCGMFTGVQDKDMQYFSYLNTNFKLEFTATELKGVRSPLFEPKLLSHCYSLTLRDSNGGEYNYNPLLYNNNQIEIEYNEPNSITNSNYYIRFVPKGVYPISSNSNWTGVTNTVDNSLPIANDNMANFIANNKNFLLTQGVATATNLVGNLLQGNFLGAATGLAGDLFRNFVTTDNIENMKRNIINANNTAALTLIVNEGINFYVDIEQSYAIDEVRFYNFIYKNGYQLDKIGNVYDYMFNRHYFNFVQAEIEKINMVIPQFAKDKIREIFRNGVRLWHDYIEMYNYDKENYEEFIP